MITNLDASVRLLKTIADVTRLRILGLLAERPRTGRDLVKELELSPPTVSHHMARLTEVGVVTAEADGARRVYRLDEALLRDVRGERPMPAAFAVDSTDEARARAVRTFFDGRRLTSIPARRKARVAVLLELLRWFTPGRTYTEAEVNAILREAHPDVAFLRRELVDYRYLRRENGTYWVATEPPTRDANESQEVPADEAAWLGALIRSAVGASPAEVSSARSADG